MCPALMSQEWIKDPRLSKDINWWVANVFSEFMKDCVIFCYIPDFAGVTTQRMEAEKQLWRDMGNSKFIIADRIIDYLLNLESRYDIR